MFGIRYTVVCPRCRTAYETDHGITNYYKISGKGNDQDYCHETCPNCNLEFFHLGGDEFVLSSRYHGLTSSECAADKIKMMRHFRKVSISEEEHVCSVIDELYAIPLEDIAIPVSDVKEEDIRWSTTICW